MKAYRPEIDGLRALAVLSVMLFHAGFDAFAGGYVGVDVFFVISGYLITSILLDELRNGRFSFAAFIERRARRILPALLLVLLVCVPFAWVWSMPLEMRDFSAALLSVLGFVSNIWFWRSNGYFDHQAEISPLLHTWSLAVEEQYYLIFPLLFVLLWRLRREHRWIAILVAAVISLALAQWGAYNRPAANFYLLPTRGWEFLIGALLAMAPFEPMNPARSHARQALAAVGLAMVGFAIWGYDDRTPFPGLAALLPTAGTALLIACAQPSTGVGRLLASRPLVGVGLISYSAYLWHQPLFAFVRQQSLERPQMPLMLGLVTLSLAMAWLSWKHVETPWRDHHRMPRRWLVSGVVGCSTALAAFGVAGLASDGFPQRLTSAERELMSHASYRFHDVYREGVCFLHADQTWRSFSTSCTGTAPGATLIWGDSHAAALSHGLRQVLGDVAQFSASGCPPLAGVHRLANPNCAAINDHVLTEIARLKPARVVVHANWTLYADLKPLVQLPITLARIAQASPASRIMIIGPVPQWYLGLPSAMRKRGIVLAPAQHLETPMYAELVSVDQSLQALATRSGVEFRSALHALCDGARCPVTLRDGGAVTLMAWDYGHLTAAGSVMLARRLMDRE